MALTPQEVLATARLFVMEKVPYLSAGILHMVFRESSGLGTFGSTKNWIVLWDPVVVEKWGMKSTAAVLVHELMHLINNHHDRRTAVGAEPALWNIAGDLAINPSVREMGFDLPKHALFSHDIDRAWPSVGTAEEYWRLLLKEGVRYTCAGEDPNVESESSVIRTPNGAVIIRPCGSCAGNRLDGEGADDDPDGRSQQEQERARIVIAQAISGWGSAPSSLKRWAGQALVPPKIRWQDKLGRSCRVAVAFRAGAGMATYSRISRRQAGLGFGPGKPSVPAFRGTVPRATFLVDTSGSMTDDQLRTVMSEASGVLAACGATMDVVVCDAEVHAARTVRSVDEACGLLKGGGGSDFRPAFEQIARARPKSDVIVAATDGYISVPDAEPPGQRVIWLLIGSQVQRPCDWGTHIVVD